VRERVRKKRVREREEGATSQKLALLSVKKINRLGRLAIIILPFILPHKPWGGRDTVAGDRPLQVG